MLSCTVVIAGRVMHLKRVHMSTLVHHQYKYAFLYLPTFFAVGQFCSFCLSCFAGLVEVDDVDVSKLYYSIYIYCSVTLRRECIHW